MEKRLSIIAIIAFLFLAQSVEAISLGTVVKKDTLSASLVESAKFTILFWNVEDTPYKVELEVKEAPKGWLIIMQPKEFLLDSSTGEEYIVLSGKSVKAFPVNVFVKPTSAEPGTYSISIAAKAGHTGEGIFFFQERIFKLNLEVLGEKYTQEAEKPSQSANVPERIVGELSKPQASNYLFYLMYVLLILCILVVSLLIYKYA